MPDNNFCQICGAPLEEKALFCIMCGAPVPMSTAPQQVEAVVQEPVRSKSPRVLVLIILLAAAAGFAVWHYSLLDRLFPPIEGGPLALSTLSTDSNFMVQQGDATQPEYFLPDANLKLTFVTEYYPGDTSTVYKVTAGIATDPWISEADIFIDGTNQTYGGITHYLSLPEGVFSLFEEQPDQVYMLYPRNVKKGAKWVYNLPEGMVVWTIKETCIECQTNYGTLTNCLLVEQDNKIFNTTTWYYYAPGLGRVQEKSIDEGCIIFDLSAVEQLGAEQAFTIVQSYSRQS